MITHTYSYTYCAVTIFPLIPSTHTFVSVCIFLWLSDFNIFYHTDKYEITLFDKMLDLGHSKTHSMLIHNKCEVQHGKHVKTLHHMHISFLFFLVQLGVRIGFLQMMTHFEFASLLICACIELYVCVCFSFFIFGRSFEGKYCVLCPRIATYKQSIRKRMRQLSESKTHSERFNILKMYPNIFGRMPFFIVRQMNWPRGI